MRLWVKKIRARELSIAEGEATVLIPAGVHDEEQLQKLPWDRDLRADVVAPRNPGLHRKAFVLLNLVWPHTNYPTVERLRAAMTIGAGFVDEAVDCYTGKVIWYPKSWSFENLDDVEFQELYNRLIDVALKIVPNSKRPDWEAAVDHIVRM